MSDALMRRYNGAATVSAVEAALAMARGHSVCLAENLDVAYWMRAGSGAVYFGCARVALNAQQWAEAHPVARFVVTP